MTEQDKTRHDINKKCKLNTKYTSPKGSKIQAQNSSNPRYVRVYNLTMSDPVHRNFESPTITQSPDERDLGTRRQRARAAINFFTNLVDLESKGNSKLFHPWVL